MLSKFRSLYPTGSLISELAAIHHGKYVVRTLIWVNGENLGSGLASAETVELAEDLARKRAIENLELDSAAPIISPKAKAAAPTETVSQQRPAVEKLMEVPASRKQLPEVEKPMEVATTQELVKSPTKTNAKTKAPEVEKKAVLPTQKEPPPIASNVTLNPVTIPPESDHFDSDKWLEESSDSKSEFELQQFSSTSAIGSDRPTDELTSTSISPSQNTEITATSEPLDLSNTTAKIDVLLSNLNWSKERERDYLEQTYGEKMRSLLNEEKLLDFQQYLEVLDKVTTKIKAIGWRPKQEKDYLKNHQGGRSREELSAEELTEFLEYLDIFDRITEKIKELGWTNEQGKNYLSDNYGVKARTGLSQDKLHEFLLYLETL